MNIFQRLLYTFRTTVVMNTHCHYCYCVEVKRIGDKRYLYYDKKRDAERAWNYYQGRAYVRMFVMMEIKTGEEK